MPTIVHVKKAQQRYHTVPVLNPDGTPKVVPVLRKDGTPKLTKKGRPVTMRVTETDKSRPKPNIRCGKCGTEILPGMPYKWTKTKSTYGGTVHYRCQPCPNWKQSELSSSKMAGVYAAQEQCQEEIDGCETADDLRTLAGDLAEQIRAVAQEYIESADNMEEGFGHATSMSDELREKGESLESWADDIDNLDFEDFEEEEIDEEDEDAQEEQETARDDHMDTERSKLSDEMDNCPV